MALTVTEIFHSIQGESSFAGRPCVFVRLAGCNLRCAWCDTPYSWEGGEPMSVAAVVERVLAYACPLAEVTGGEPLLQPETPALVRALLDRGLEVLVETNGSLPVDVLDARAVAIVDVKCPGSAMDALMAPNLLASLRPRDELKFVLADRADFDYAARIVRGLPAPERGARILADPERGTRALASTDRVIHFSPVGGSLDPAELAAWILAEGLPVRLGLQQHKIIWHPDARGV